LFILWKMLPPVTYYHVVWYKFFNTASISRLYSEADSCWVLAWLTLQAWRLLLFYFTQPLTNMSTRSKKSNVSGE
jgi:hypothetical protein